MTDRKRPQPFTQIVVVLIGLIAFLYTAGRSYAMSFTHDESITYLMLKLFRIRVLHIEHVQNVTYLSLQLDRITHVFNANNHLLNTALMKLSMMVFGDREWALRLPSLAAHLGYLAFTYRLLRLRSSGVLLICGFILLNLNPFVLDFFSIARGYGLAISLMTVSLYYFITAHSYRQYMRAYLLCFLAVYANFTLFNFYLCLLLCHLLIELRKQPQFSMRDLWRRLAGKPGFIFLQGVFFLVTVVVLAALSKGNQLYVGSRSVAGALNSLSLSALYENARLVLIAKISAILIACCLLLIAFGLRTAWSKKDTGPAFITGFLLIGCVVISVSEFLLVHVPLPEGRTGLYLFPLFYLALFFMLDAPPLKQLHSVRRTVIPALAVCSVLNFCLNANMASVLYMPYDACTRQAYERIAQDAAGKDVTVFADWSFEPALNYYRVSRKNTAMRPVFKQKEFTLLRRDAADGYTYMYLYDSQLVGNEVPGSAALARFGRTKTVLLKR